LKTYYIKELVILLAIFSTPYKPALATNDTPQKMNLTTARECLRSSRGKFTNYCNFKIAFTWCFHIGGKDPKAWKKWINGSNSCNRGVHRMSPPIAPNEDFPFPTERMPRSPDGKWSAGLKFIKAVRFP